MYRELCECLQIADFGMSRDLMTEDYYVSHGGKVPVKWTAPEVPMSSCTSRKEDLTCTSRATYKFNSCCMLGT